MGLTHSDQEFEPLITAKEAAKYLGFSSLTVLRWAHEGRLPSVAFPYGKTGKFTHRFRKSDLAAYLATLEHKSSLDALANSSSTHSAADAQSSANHPANG